MPWAFDYSLWSNFLCSLIIAVAIKEYKLRMRSHVLNIQDFCLELKNSSLNANFCLFVDLMYEKFNFSSLEKNSASHYILQELDNQQWYSFFRWSAGLLEAINICILWHLPYMTNLCRTDMHNINVSELDFLVSWSNIMKTGSTEFTR